jgi:hypothetical protein
MSPYAIEQLSVFIENKAGELVAITSLLEAESISLCSIMLADSSEFALLRLLTPEAERAKETLLAHGFVAQSSYVFGVRIENHVGSFNKVVKTLAAHHIDINYTYTVNEKNDGIFMFKINQAHFDVAMEVLLQNDITLISKDDL